MIEDYSVQREEARGRASETGGGKCQESGKSCTKLIDDLEGHFVFTAPISSIFSGKLSGGGLERALERGQGRLHLWVALPGTSTRIPTRSRDARVGFVSLRKLEMLPRGRATEGKS